MRSETRSSGPMPERGPASIRRRGTVLIAGVLAPMALSFGLLYGVLVAWDLVAAVAVVAAVAFAGAGQRARRSGDTLGGELLTLSLVAAALAVAWLEHGVHSPGVPALVAAPAVALATVGRRCAAMTATVGTFGVVSLILAHRLGVAFTPIAPDHAYALDALAIAFSTGLVFLVSIRHDQLLGEAREEAEAQAQAKEVFFAQVSHELRTPLNVIIGYTELLLDEGHPAEGELERILASAQHQLALVDDLLDHEKAAKVGWTVQLEALDLTATAVAVVQALGPRAAVAGTALELELAHEGCAQADRRAVQQVLTNLLANAVTFGAGAPVRVTTGGGASGVFLEVTDRGPGLSAEEATRVFEPFAQGAAGKGQGTGLGLAISRQLCEAMGGTLEVESEAGQGATFRMRLRSAPPGAVRASSAA